MQVNMRCHCNILVFILLVDLHGSLVFGNVEITEKNNSSEIEKLLEETPEASNVTLYNGKERFTITNARFPVTVTHITILDPHNTVYVYWSHNTSTDIYLQTKDQYEEYQSRSYFYKIRKNDHLQWRLKNVTSSISAKKVQRIVNRLNGQKNGETKYAFQDEKFRMRILPNGSSRLIVADDKNKFDLKIFKAEFDVEISFQDFIFVDMTENIISFCGLYNDTKAVLLMTDYDPKWRKEFYKFSLSLENVLCIHPKSNFPDTWLSTNLEEPFADVYRSTTSRGVLIASQLKEPLTLAEARMLDIKHLQTVISFNHGKTWKTLKPHNNCRPSREQPNLYIDQSFSRLQLDQRHLGVLKNIDSPGVTVATGHLFYPDSSKKYYPGVFVTQDGGLNWKKVFHERLIITAIQPEWEVMLAVRNCLKGTTKRIYLSNDLGINWVYHDIFEEDVCVHNVVSGGESNSSALVILSTKPNHDGWIVTVLDFEELTHAAKPCKDSYMELWPSKEGRHFCIKGEKLLSKRRNPKKLCYILDFNANVSLVAHNCSCSQYDFVCREGKTCPSLSPTSLLKYIEKFSTESNLSNNSSNRNVSLSNGDIYRKLPFILGYRKKLRNSCIVTKSMYERTPLSSCKEVFEGEEYLSSLGNKEKLSIVLPISILLVHTISFFSSGLFKNLYFI